MAPGREQSPMPRHRWRPMRSLPFLVGMGVTSGLSAIGELMSAEGGIAGMAAADGADAEFAEAEAEQATLNNIGCFLAGTNVLLGNTKGEAIQDIHVGHASPPMEARIVPTARQSLQIPTPLKSIPQLGDS